MEQGKVGALLFMKPDDLNHPLHTLKDIHALLLCSRLNFKIEKFGSHWLKSPE